MARSWQMRASPVTRVRFRGHNVHVKRDDVFHLAGNKMRKLYWFLQQDDAFYHDAHVVSFGGTQSNAMLAIAQLAHEKHLPFTYFSRALHLKKSATQSTSLRQSEQQTQTNLAAAKALGMRHIELPVAEYHELAMSKDLAEATRRYTGQTPLKKKNLYIPQGAAYAQAEHGLCVLAEELNDYCTDVTIYPGQRPATTESQPRFTVVVPCGTGTTAFYLAQHLDPCIRLLAVPCVGDSDYLMKQFHQLAAHSAPPHDHHDHQELKIPEMLIPSQKARFGQLSWPLVDIYHELKDATGIEFDLLYATFAWQTLFEPPNLAIAMGIDPSYLCGGGSGDAPPRELLYVHTGGVSGNASMLARYEAKKTKLK